MGDHDRPRLVSDEALDRAAGGATGRDIKPMRIMKRLGQTTPIISAEPGKDAENIV